jgi:hypothetical protein
MHMVIVMMGRLPWRLVTLCCLYGLVAGCATAPTERVHYSLLEPGAQDKPIQIIVLEPDVVVKELSAGGVGQEVKQWSEQATRNVNKSVDRYVSSHADLKQVAMPDLTAAESAIVDEHVALYRVVGLTARVMTAGTDPAWAHKRDYFDYTLGSGLQFLKEKTGADVALIVAGADYVSTGGRKGMMVVGAMFGVPITLGHSNLVIAMVDLKSGDILWINSEFSYAKKDIRDSDDADDMVEGLFEEFPVL